MKTSSRAKRIASFWMLMFLVGCARQAVRVPTASATVPIRPNRSYTDLEAGSTLRIILPLTKSGQLPSRLTEEKTDANTMTLHAADLIGYTSSIYEVVGNRRDVRLKFVSAQRIENAKPAPLDSAPQLPFALPPKTAHVRLVFLVRASAADHNMAIVAAKRADKLDAFTTRLMEDPSICRSQQGLFCSWVPPGVAVRPEQATGTTASRGSVP